MGVNEISEIQTAFYSLWTRIIVSISYENSYYTSSTSGEINIKFVGLVGWF